MKIEYTLRVLDEFTCLGGDCPDNCCTDWEIPVNQEIYDKWKSLPEGEEKQRILNSVAITNQDGQQVIMLAQDPENRCVNLNSDGLCSIYAHLGPDYLGTICREYPRVSRETETKRVNTASLSCPEIARLVISADTSRTPLFTTPSAAQANALYAPDEASFISDFLDTWMSGTLAQRKYPLNVRIYYLADILCRLATLSAQGAFDPAAMRKICKEYKQELFSINLAVKNRKFRPDPFVAGSFWKFIYQAGQRLFKLNENSNEARSGLITTLASLTDELENQYHKIYEEICAHRQRARPMIRDFDSGFENYLTALFKYNGFPWYPTEGNYVATFVRCIIPFALTQLILWVKVGEGERLIPQTIWDAIYKVERTVGHGPGIYKELGENITLLRLDKYCACLLDIY